MSQEFTHFNFTAETADIERRLDVFLTEKLADFSRARVARFIAAGDVLVNGKAAKPSQKLREDDQIEVEISESPADIFTPEHIPLEVIFEDESICVVNKPAGMVVHPGAGVSEGTLANALAFHFGMKTDEFAFSQNRDEFAQIRRLKAKIGMVHRLDKDTSGLMVIAKTESATDELSRQFSTREVFKSYIALAHGEIENDAGTIDAPIGRDRNNRLKMCVRKDGRIAISYWKVQKRFSRFTLLDVEIKTGRTHQIRVHLAFIKHPVVGDETYNEGRDKTIANLEIRQAIAKLGRVFLHAEKLAFVHPITKTKVKFQAPLPTELEELLGFFERKSS